MVNLITENYKAVQRQKHAECQEWGTSGQHWVESARSFIEEHDAKTVLDYGCGKNTLLAALNDIMPEKMFLPYDPCIPEFDVTPMPSDVVLCTDVLEHIEPDLIDAVLDHIRDLTKKAAYLVIFTQPAKHVLPDGRNAHLICKGPSYWTPKLEKRFKIDSLKTGSAGQLIYEVIHGTA